MAMEEMKVAVKQPSGLETVKQELSDQIDKLDVQLMDLVSHLERVCAPEQNSPDSPELASAISPAESQHVREMWSLVERVRKSQRRVGDLMTRLEV